LRDRRSDIGELAQHFVGLACKELRKNVPNITKQQLASLEAHGWPGNVRELKNVIERAVILSSGKRLRLDLVLPQAKAGAMSKPALDNDEFLTEKEMVQLQRDNLRAAMAAADWRVSGEGGAAELLGIKPTTLTYRLKQLGVKRPPLA
jgi:DNA-binding NtrC family response regulator